MEHASSETRVPVDLTDPSIVAAIDRYWSRNVRVMAILLAIWAFAGLGCGVLLADVLNQFHVGGFPLGFWFAQQGSVIVYVFLILVYALILNRLDAAHRREVDAILRHRASRAARSAPR